MPVKSGVTPVKPRGRSVTRDEIPGRSRPRPAARRPVSSGSRTQEMIATMRPSEKDERGKSGTRRIGPILPSQPLQRHRGQHENENDQRQHGGNC